MTNLDFTYQSINIANLTNKYNFYKVLYSIHTYFCIKIYF